MNDFEKGFASGFIGYIIGAYIDNNTKFGYWLNTNPVVTLIWNAGKLLLLGAGAFAALYFLYCVMTSIAS